MSTSKNVSLMEGWLNSSKVEYKVSVRQMDGKVFEHLIFNEGEFSYFRNDIEILESVNKTVLVDNATLIEHCNNLKKTANDISEVAKILADRHIWKTGVPKFSMESLPKMMFWCGGFFYPIDIMYTGNTKHYTVGNYAFHKNAPRRGWIYMHVRENELVHDNCIFISDISAPFTLPNTPLGAPLGEDADSIFDSGVFMWKEFILPEDELCDRRIGWWRDDEDFTAIPMREGQKIPE